MSLKSILSRIVDDLDSHQIVVRLIPAEDGVDIEAGSYADLLIARKELQKHGLFVAQQKIAAKDIRCNTEND